MDLMSTTSTLTLNNSMDTLSSSSALQSLTQAKKNDPKKIEKASKDFESFLISYMVKEMRKSIPNDGILPRSDAENSFQEALDQNYSKVLAEKGGLGLSRIMIERWRKNISVEDKQAEI